MSRSNELYEKVKAFIDKIIESTPNPTIEKFIDKADKTLKDFAGNIEVLRFIIKLAWKYEEKNCEIYGLEDAIKWFKSNIPGRAVSGCIFKENLIIGYKLHHCFIDNETNKPLLDGSWPHLTVHAMRLNDNLIKQFGAKDMLILR